jgi:hypothetical protein
LPELIHLNQIQVSQYVQTCKQQGFFGALFENEQVQKCGLIVVVPDGILLHKIGPNLILDEKASISLGEL